MNRKFSRRELLKFFVAIIPAACSGIVNPANQVVPTQAAAAKNPAQPASPAGITPAESTVTPRAYLPMIASPVVNGSKVIHVYNSNATNWDFTSNYYYDHVNQEVVNQMVDTGLKAVTGAGTVTDAWRSLLTGYKAGDKVAIKVNFNNSKMVDKGGGVWKAEYNGNTIDGVFEPVNALIAGLVAFGVLPGNITVCDPSRPLPQRFRDAVSAHFPGVHFVGAGGGGEKPEFSKKSIKMNLTTEVTDRKLCDTFVNAQHLINMPIMKEHGITGVTLGFKNHYGSIDQVVRNTLDDLHPYSSPGNPKYSASNIPQVTIFADVNISGKTRLTVGDGLFGAKVDTQATPSRWGTFGGDSPNSLLFSRDPVAIDCVMMDLLAREHPLAYTNADDYLKLANQKNFGVYERDASLSGKYTKIAYLRI